MTTVDFGTLKVTGSSQQTDVLLTERVLQEVFSDSAARTHVITEHHVLLQRDYEQVCTCVYVRACVCVRVYVCMCACVGVCVREYILYG